MQLKIGDKAPEFSGTDQDGNLISLSNFAGKWVLLYFYPKDDTPGCTREACNFRDNMEKLKNEVNILGVSADSLESHKKFSQKYNLNFPIIPDPKKEIIGEYGATGLAGMLAKRSSFLIDPSGKIAKIYEKVNPDNHVSEVEKDLKELL